MKVAMKTQKILLFAALCLIAASCSKDSTPLPENDGQLKVFLAEDALSKAYFANEDSDETPGKLLWRHDRIFLVGIPVEEDGAGGQILRYDLAVTSSSDSYGNSNWSDNEAESRYVYSMDKTPHDFFTQSDKCIFFLLSGGDSWWGNGDQYWRYDTPGEGSGYSYFTEYMEWKKLQASGADHYYMKSAVSQIQYDYGVNSSDAKYYRNYVHCQTICGHTDVLTESEIVEDDNYTISFPTLRLVNALLRFKIQLDGETPITMRNLRITLKNDADHSGEGAWYHVLSGQTFTDFDAFQSDQYTMYSIPQLEAMYPGENDFSGYHTFDSIMLGWSMNNEWDATEDITLSSTPTDRWFYACVMPQSEYIDENSYLLFEALDLNGVALSSVKRTLPSGGFVAGTRYDFTLTLPSVHSDLGAVDAGKYDTVRDW